MMVRTESNGNLILWLTTTNDHYFSLGAGCERVVTNKREEHGLNGHCEEHGLNKI